MTMKKRLNSAYIDKIAVGSVFPFIVYGSVRGLVSEHRLLRAAQSAARKEWASFSEPYYSDAQVYCWDDEDGWCVDATD